MLRIYSVSISLCAELKPVVDVIERRDADLARQLGRALSSVPLNIAEGSQVSGGNRSVRYRTAMGSLRESLACLELAQAWGYIEPVSDELRARFTQVGGTLHRCVSPR
ncbi:MAG: four helix bundle protein [Deltaproteobacteria bacterium]|nr:four helix bundle protein [Deltaproteobacteria bacterium]